MAEFSMSVLAPHRAILFVLGLAFAAGLCVQDANAAFDTYLKFEGVRGESREAAHQGWIEVSSFQFGTSRGTTIGSATGGAGAGKVSVQDIHITKTVDSTSPLLMQACASGKHFPTVVLEHTLPGGRTEKIILQDVLISSAQKAGAGGEENPTESITLNFAKISISYSNAKERTNAMPMRTMAPLPTH
jgi:type VI secretion system secreted protein Hcp